MKTIFLITLLFTQMCFGDKFWISCSQNIQIDITNIEKENGILDIIPGHNGEYIIRYASNKFPTP